MALCALCGGTKVGRKCPRCNPRQQRQTAAQRGYGYRWRVASEAYLAMPENRICRICNRRLADCVDHIIDHHGDMSLFWDQDNWQPACRACNTRKANKDRRKRRKR